jgi:hypothetical protein
MIKQIAATACCGAGFLFRDFFYLSKSNLNPKWPASTNARPVGNAHELIPGISVRAPLFRRGCITPADRHRPRAGASDKVCVYLAESFSTSTWRVLLSGPRHPHRGRSGTPDRRRDALLVRDPEWSNKNRLALGGDVILIFQPIPKPAVNDLPLIANRTKIEKVRPFSL